MTKQIRICAYARAAAAFTASMISRVAPHRHKFPADNARDLVLVRIGMRIEQLAHHHDEARRAEAALKRAGLDEGFLNGSSTPPLDSASTVSTLLPSRNHASDRQPDTAMPSTVPCSSRTGPARSFRARRAGRSGWSACRQGFVAPDVGARRAAVEREVDRAGRAHASVLQRCGPWLALQARGRTASGVSGNSVDANADGVLESRWRSRATRRTSCFRRRPWRRTGRCVSSASARARCAALRHVEDAGNLVIRERARW